MNDKHAKIKISTPDDLTLQRAFFVCCDIAFSSMDRSTFLRLAGACWDVYKQVNDERTTDKSKVNAE